MQELLSVASEVDYFLEPVKRAYVTHVRSAFKAPAWELRWQR